MISCFDDISSYIISVVQYESDLTFEIEAKFMFGKFTSERDHLASKTMNTSGVFFYTMHKPKVHICFTDPSRRQSLIPAV